MNKTAYYYINTLGEVNTSCDDGSMMSERHKSTGNYYTSYTEACLQARAEVLMRKWRAAAATNLSSDVVFCLEYEQENNTIEVVQPMGIEPLMRPYCFSDYKRAETFKTANLTELLWYFTVFLAPRQLATFTAIAAVDHNNNIGAHGTLGFTLPEDMEHFREWTLGRTIICGSRTLSSFPKGLPLPDRHTIVLSRNKSLKVPGAIVVHDIQELLKVAPADSIVVGGGQVYEELLPYTSTIILTHMDTTIEGADTSFPLLPSQSWELIHATHPATSVSGIPYYFAYYRRTQHHE